MNFVKFCKEGGRNMENIANMMGYGKDRQYVVLTLDTEKNTYYGDIFNHGGFERMISTNPLNPDTDGDGLLDGYSANVTGPSWDRVHKYADVYAKLNSTWGGWSTALCEMDLHTDPFNPDTDGDGIADGAEAKLVVAMLDASGIVALNLSLIGAVLHSRDYDNDSIPDSVEYEEFEWAQEHDESEFMSVVNASDASEDFDYDGLTNLQEYRLDAALDYDADGILDIYDEDDDNDGIPTSVEIQYHLNAFNAADANGDLDHDGLSNLFEYEHNLSISDADSDHDGINDGKELNYWESRLSTMHPDWSAEQVLNMAVNYTLNPDVDNDSIPDGKEIKGYTVKIITGWAKNGTPISEKRFVAPSELDPLTPYTNSSGVYLDTDEDGIPDVVEKWFGNVSIITNYTYRQEFISLFGWSLYDKYSWVIGYFWTIYNHDYKEHHNHTSAFQNATEWLQDQFNPMVVDKTPPVISLFELRWEVQFSVSMEPVKVYAKIHLVVRDVGGIYSLRIVDESSGAVYTVDTSNHETMYDVQHRFKASALDASFGAVKIRVTTWDYAGNTLSVEKKLKGELEQMLDVLAEMWSEFWAKLCEAAQAVANAVNVILKWLEDLISSVFTYIAEMIKAGFHKLIDAMKNFIGAVVEWIEAGSSETTSGKVFTVNGKLADSNDVTPVHRHGALYYVIDALNAFMELICAMAMWIMALFLSAIVALAILKFVTGGMEAFLEFVGGELIKNEIVPLLFTAGVLELGNTVADILKLDNPLGALMEWIGISGAEVEHLYTLYDIQKAKMSGKIHLWGYFIGLVLAISGMLAPIVIPMLNLDHNGTLYADYVCIVIALGGFVYSRWLAKHDKPTEAVQESNKLIPILEFILSLMGVVTPIVKTIGDLSGGE